MARQPADAPPPKRPPSNRHRLSEADWSQMVEAFREAPGDHITVARAVGVDKRTAMKAWEIGLPYPFATKPIRDIVAEGQITERAKRGTPEGEGPPATPREARQRAAADASDTRVQEARLVSTARKNITQVLQASGDLSRAVVVLAAKVKRQVRAMAEEVDQDGKPKPVDLAVTVRLIRDVASTQRSAVIAADLVMAMERQLLGDPGEAETSEDELTEEEAIRELEEGTTALERARARGLTAIAGGLAKP